MSVSYVLFGLFSYRIAQCFLKKTKTEKKTFKKQGQGDKTENGILQPLELFR